MYLWDLVSLAYLSEVFMERTCRLVVDLVVRCDRAGQVVSHPWIRSVEDPLGPTPSPPGSPGTDEDFLGFLWRNLPVGAHLCENVVSSNTTMG